MRFLVAAVLFLLASPTEAKRRAPEIFFSVCGNFAQETKELELADRSRLVVDGPFLPPSSGRFCLRGYLAPAEGKGPWGFRASQFSPAPAELRFPVMVCGETFENAFYWGAEKIQFPGPLPKEEAPYGWCADSKSLPQRAKKGWTLPAEQYRQLPDSHSRSGMSIGNQ